MPCSCRYIRELSEFCTWDDTILYTDTKKWSPSTASDYIINMCAVLNLCKPLTRLLSTVPRNSVLPTSSPRSAGTVEQLKTAVCRWFPASDEAIDKAGQVGRLAAWRAAAAFGRWLVNSDCVEDSWIFLDELTWLWRRGFCSPASHSRDWWRC